jgi:hypothetical protein
MISRSSESEAVVKGHEVGSYEHAARDEGRPESCSACTTPGTRRHVYVDRSGTALSRILLICGIRTNGTTNDAQLRRVKPIIASRL